MEHCLGRRRYENLRQRYNTIQNTLGEKRRHDQSHQRTTHRIKTTKINIFFIIKVCK